jgi:hypothetical protein
VWSVLATIANTPSVSQSGTWGVLATVSNTVNVLATISNIPSVAQSGSWIVNASIPAVVQVGDNSGSLTVDGTVAATQSGNWIVNASIPAVVSIQGDVAHDAVDSGNPQKVGGKAVSSLVGATLVAAADRANFISDLDGVHLIRANKPLADTMSERVSDTGGTSTSFATFASVTGLKNYVTGYSVFNSSATAGYVDFRNGTGGAVLWTVPLPAGGGANVISDNPIFATSAATVLAYDVSAALTTVYISVTGFQSKA